MILPVAIVMILLARFLLEAGLARQEVSVYTRMGTHSAAAVGSASAVVCQASTTAFTGRTDVTQSATLTCTTRDAEIGLSRERPFWDAVGRGAAAWRAILKDVRPTGPVNDVVGNGSGTLDVSGSPFLDRRQTVNADYRFIAAQDVLWRHDQPSFARGHDQAIWQELRKRGTYRLFPEVFPSR